MLDAFLEDMARQPFSDGASDCVLTVADWVVTKGHPDPAAPFRGRYGTARQRLRLVREAGGMVALMEAGASRAGLEPTAEPLREDVGLILAHGQAVAAICLGRQWALKGEGLVVAEPAEILAAWRV